MRPARCVKRLPRECLRYVRMMREGGSEGGEEVGEEGGQRRG